jgi:hypothetical protein
VGGKASHITLIHTNNIFCAFKVMSLNDPLLLMW